MIRRACRIVAIAAAVAAVNAVRPVAAEPVTILGGVIEYSRSNQAFFKLTLVNGWMQGEFGDGGSESWTPAHSCFPCTAGSTINPSVSESMPQSADITVGGTLSLNNADYFISHLSFTINADPVRLPNSFGGGDALAHSSIAQFVLRGLVQGSNPNAQSATGLVLLGFGKAQMNFLGDGSWFSTNFRFEDPAAVPEPSTLLLFATGAAGAARRWRRRRS